MGSTPTATSGLPTPPASQPSAPKIGFTLERAAAWALPLGALTTLLVGVGLAIRAGELPWFSAGVIVYALCVAVWIGLCFLKRAHRRTLEASQSTASPLPRVPSATSGVAQLSQGAPTQVSSIPESQPIREALIFARYAVWFLPFLALVSLLLANTEAALSHQLKWIQCTLFSFAGCLLVWILHLLGPWIERYRTSAQATTSGSPPAPGLLSQLGSAALPCFSLLALAITLLTAADASQIQWLTGGILSFTGYVVLALGLSLRTRYWVRPPQPGTEPGMGSSADLTLRSNWVIRLAMPAIALTSVALALGMAARIHHVKWYWAGLIIFAACMITWFLQSVLLSPDPPPLLVFDPPSLALSLALLTCAMLALLVLASYKREITYLEAALLAVLGGLALGFSFNLVVSLAKTGPPQIESNLGLGGGMGGWRVSESFTYLLCALTLAVCLGFSFLEIHARSSTSIATVSTSATTKVTPVSVQPVGSVGSVSSAQNVSNSPDQKSPPK